MGYVNEGLIISVGTFPQAQKVTNIQHCPKVSLTIDRDYEDSSQIQGLSMGGTAEILTDPEEIRRVGALFQSQVSAARYATDPL